MKIGDIAKNYNLDQNEFLSFLQEKMPEIKIKMSLLGLASIEDYAVEKAVSAYKKFQEEKQIREEYFSNMMITSGFNFDGYRVIKYSGYISGDDVIQIDRGTAGGFFSTATNVGVKLMESLVVMRRNAIRELKEAAYALGCNAVIGVDFDYLTLDPETANKYGGTTYLPYVFGVTANGNAVVIEKIEDEK